MRRLPTLLAAAALLGGTAASGLEARVEAQTRAALRVGVMGDSHSEDAELPGRYVGHLSGFCPGIEFRTYGVRGQGVRQMWERFPRDILGRGFDEVIILAGGNDIASGRSVSHIQDYLGRMYRAADRAGMRVVASTLTPHGSSPLGWDQERQRKLLQVNEWIRSRPSGVDSVVDAYSLLEDERHPGNLPRAFGLLHLTREGHRQLGNAVYDSAYQPICARLRRGQHR
jgi:hypothetical protein